MKFGLLFMDYPNIDLQVTRGAVNNSSAPERHIQELFVQSISRIPTFESIYVEVTIADKYKIGRPVTRRLTLITR